MAVTHISKIVAGPILFAMCTALHAKEISVLEFSFEIPDHWYFDGKHDDRKDRDMIYLSPSREPYVLPVIVAMGCKPSKSQSCEVFSRFPPRDVEAVCTQAKIARSDGISESRWICDPEIVEGKTLSGGFAQFQHDGQFLTISCQTSDQTTISLLESISKSLKYHERKE